MNKNIINDIEILRAVAVMLVVTHHAFGNLFTWQTPLMRDIHGLLGGSYGVDLFFVISGYVIARDLVPRLQSAGTRSAMWRVTQRFWLRRAYRLLPSAWLWLAIMLLLSLAFNETNAFSSVSVNIDATIAGILQFANVRFAQTFMSEPYGASFAYWSLSLEEQFYLVLPIVFIVFRRWAIVIGLAALFYQSCTERILYGVTFRSEALILGVMLAMYAPKAWLGKHSHFILTFAQIAGPLLLIFFIAMMAAVCSIELPVNSQKYTLLAILSLALVWIASWNKNIFMPIPFMSQLLTWIGSRSYGIYLIHIPAFFATREIWFRISGAKIFDATFFWPFLLTASILLLLFVELNYRWLEMPFRKAGARISERFITPGYPKANRSCPMQQ